MSKFLKLCVLMSAVMVAGTAAAERYVGDRCWDLDLSLLGGVQGEARFAISRVSDGHFSLIGTGTLGNGGMIANAGPVKGVIVAQDGQYDMLLDWVITLDGEPPYVSHNSLLAVLDENGDAMVSGVSNGNASLLGGVDTEVFTGRIFSKPCDSMSQ